jgi:hypothetical protein
MRMRWCESAGTAHAYAPKDLGPFSPIHRYVSPFPQFDDNGWDDSNSILKWLLPGLSWKPEDRYVEESRVGGKVVGLRHSQPCSTITFDRFKYAYRLVRSLRLCVCLFCAPSTALPRPHCSVSWTSTM